ncbi:MAG: GAF domain-containing protein [Pseudomonadota bacterium]
MDDDVAEHRQWLREKTHALLTRFSSWRRSVKIGLVIGGALLAGSSGAAANLVSATIKWPFYVFQIFGVLLVFAGGVAMEFLDEGAADAIKRANDLADIAEERESDIAALEGDFEWFTRIYATATAFREIVEGSVALPGTAEDRGRRFAALLDILVAEKAVLFGMDADRWNFAIYLFDAKDGVLACVTCRRPIRAEEEAPHRSWKPGEGHIGIAFQTQREIVASDTAEPEARALFDAPEASRRDDDVSRYRSIASIPIRLAGEAPIGVLAATSDIPGRFWLRQRDEEGARDPVEPLRILASALALIVRTADFKGAPQGFKS